MSRCVAHLRQGRRAEVGHVVAGLVVAGVVGLTGGAAEDRGLLGGLDALGAGEQAAGGDADGDERAVVGAAAELRRRRGQVLAVEVVDEQLLDLRRPGRAGGVGVGAVAVVDEADVVRRADHVEVQVRHDLRQGRVAEAVDVVLGAEQAGLLGAPEREADLLARLDAGLGHLLGDLEDRRGAGAVVVDARAAVDGVEVGADDDGALRSPPGVLAMTLLVWASGSKEVSVATVMTTSSPASSCFWSAAPSS